jgi:hypothetical protein
VRRLVAGGRHVAIFDLDTVKGTLLGHFVNLTLLLLSSSSLSFSKNAHLSSDLFPCPRFPHPEPPGKALVAELPSGSAEFYHVDVADYHSVERCFMFQTRTKNNNKTKKSCLQNFSLHPSPTLRYTVRPYITGHDTTFVVHSSCVFSHHNPRAILAALLDTALHCTTRHNTAGQDTKDQKQLQRNNNQPKQGGVRGGAVGGVAGQLCWMGPCVALYGHRACAVEQGTPCVARVRRLWYVCVCVSITKQVAFCLLIVATQF